MIPKPGDANREVTVTETFYVQTDNELSDKELKQIEADDQAIQTILLGLPEDIYAAEKKAKLFNEWERFTSNEGESIESYYHCFLKLINDLKRNKHFPEKIASNMKFLNNLQPEWSRHVTIVHQTKDLHIAHYTQLYDFFKYNQKENYLQQPMLNPKDITDPTTAMNMALVLMAKAFKLNYSTPTNNNQRISSNPRNRQIPQPGINMGQDRQMQMVGGNGGNQFRQGVEHYARNCTVRPRRRDAAYLQTLLLIAQKEEAGIQLQVEEYDLMAVVADLDEIEEVNANCILMANLQQASTSGTQTDNTPVYDSDGSTENDNDVISEDTSVEQGQSIQTNHMLSPKPDSFYHNEQKMAFGYQNPFYLKQAQKKQQSLYDGNVLLEKHDPPVVHDSEETLQLAQENDTTPSVARKFINEVKSTIVTLQRVVKHRMTIETHNWSYSAHQELHKIEEAKFVGDFKSLANEADASLAKHKALELEIERLLKAIVSQDIMIIMQNESIVDTSDLQTELERTKARFENCIIKKENEYAKLWNDWYKKFTSNSVSKSQEPKAVNNDKVIAPGMFRINPFKTSREEKHVPNTVSASNRTKPIAVSQPHVFTKKDVNSDLNGLSSTGPKVTKPKKVGTLERVPTPKPRKSRLPLRWSPTGKLFDQEGKIVDSSEPESQSDCSNGDNAYLEVAFRRNACFIINLEGVDLLKGDRSTNLYTINLHEMAYASPICLMARASSTKSWLWHQRLSHLNFDTLNDLARNDLVSGLPKFKYHKEHLCPSCEQGKRKRVSHPPKHVPNSRQRLHLLHMDMLRRLLLRVSLKTASSFTVISTKHHTSLLTVENWISHFFMYSVLSVIPIMIVKTLGSLVQKVILVFSLGILVTPQNWATAEYDVLGALLHRSIAQDMRTTSKRVV
nr:retrovirus-related Pol polyprotein from transposon TNT 1-94 [Tanacetum cinerariifolium]